MRNRNECIRHNSLPVTALRYTPVTLLQMTPYSCRMLNMVGVTVNTYCLPIYFQIRLACLANTKLGDTITNGHQHADSHSNEKCVTYAYFEKLECTQKEIYILIE